MIGLKKYFVLVVFLSLVFGLSIGGAFYPIRSFSENENRVLAEKPEFSKNKLMNGSFQKEYESYVTDQFLFRDSWITAKTWTFRALGKMDVNGVYFAKDKYYIERVDSTDVERELVEKNITRVDTFLDKYGKTLGSDHVYAMVVPTAFDILSDKLPLFSVGYSQEKLLDTMKTKYGTQWIDLRNVLKSHSKDYIFYRTDHHWTSLGAFYAYQEAAKAYHVEPQSMDAYQINKVSDSFLGTLYSKVNIKRSKDDMFVFDDGGSYTVEYDMNGIKKNSMFELAHLEGKDKYAMYLDGNHAFVEIHSDNKNGRKLLILKDSYANSFAPFMAAHFEMTFLIDFRYMSMPVSSIIKQYGVTDLLLLYNANSFIADKNLYQLLR